MGMVIELELHRSNMSRKDGLTFSRSCKPLIHCLLRQHSRTPPQMVDMLTVPSKTTSLFLHHISSKIPCWILQCPPSLTTPFRPLFMCSLSCLSKGLHLQGVEPFAIRPLWVGQAAPALHGDHWCWPQHTLTLGGEISPCVPVTPFSTSWSPQLLPH
jgi:hypothetical protein